MSAPNRLIVFVDYQNTYMSARETFDFIDEYYYRGQVRPWDLGLRLTEMDNDHRNDGGRSELTQVRLYCGLPDPRKDAVGNAARMRQIQAWGRTSGVQVYHRPLRYPPEYPRLPAQEKGVDVQLSVDVIRMALQGEYDVGIIFSRDTDLRPVLEAMEDLYPITNVPCRVAAWQSGSGSKRGLRVPGRHIWCHYIGRSEFLKIEDSTDYRRERPGEVLPNWR